MDTGLRDAFIDLWGRYFPGADLPITFELGGKADGVKRAAAPKGWRCFVCDLAKIRRGESLVFGEESVGCRGARFYLGYDTERFEDFRSFLSYGKPGIVEGERYKQTPEIVDMLGFEVRYRDVDGGCEIGDIPEARFDDIGASAR